MKSLETQPNLVEKGSENSPPKNITPLPSETYIVQALPGILRQSDLIAAFVLIIFFVTNVVSVVAAGASSITYFAIGAVVFFIPCSIVTAQLGVLHPHEGSLYNWTHKALGGYWSFFVAFCAWFPGVLVMISASDALVGFLQGLSPDWLHAPWQQGLVICVVIIFSGIVSLQRYRSVSYALRGAALLTLIPVVLLGCAMAFWLLNGHTSTVNFGNIDNWGIHWSGSLKNIGIFGLVILAYLGVEAPLNMGGEIIGSAEKDPIAFKTITEHLLWGTILVIVGYLVSITAELVILGPTAGSASIFSLVTAVGNVLGTVPAIITVICLMSFCIFTTIVYNLTYARLLLVASIDKRLPMSSGKLNRNRVPANAIIFQTIVALAITLIVFVGVPFFTPIENQGNLTIEVYNVMLASSALVWAFSTLFLFINMARFLLKDPGEGQRKFIFPKSVLIICVVVGSVASIAAIVDTLFFSWIAALINNTIWLYIIGGSTIICLILSAIGSMFASSEASWETISRGS